MRVNGRLHSGIGIYVVGSRITNTDLKRSFREIVLKFDNSFIFDHSEASDPIKGTMIWSEEPTNMLSIGFDPRPLILRKNVLPFTTIGEKIEEIKEAWIDSFDDVAIRIGVAEKGGIGITKEDVINKTINYLSNSNKENETVSEKEL